MPSQGQLSRLVVIAPDWLAGQVIRVRSTRMTVGRGQTDVYLVWRVGSDFTVCLRDNGACRLLRLLFCVLVMSRD